MQDCASKGNCQESFAFTRVTQVCSMLGQFLSSTYNTPIALLCASLLVNEKQIMIYKIARMNLGVAGTHEPRKKSTVFSLACFLA